MDKSYIKDKTLGSLYYDNAWKKHIKIDVDEERYSVTVIMESYSEEPVTDIQREAFKDYKRHQDMFTCMLSSVLLEFYKSNYKKITKNTKVARGYSYKHINKENIMKLVKPQSLLIRQDGKYGLVCSCEWGTPANVYVTVTNGKLTVCRYSPKLHLYKNAKEKPHN